MATHRMACVLRGLLLGVGCRPPAQQRVDQGQDRPEKPLISPARPPTCPPARSCSTPAETMYHWGVVWLQRSDYKGVLIINAEAR